MVPRSVIGGQRLLCRNPHASGIVVEVVVVVASCNIMNRLTLSSKAYAGSIDQFAATYYLKYGQSQKLKTLWSTSPGSHPI